MDKELIDEKFKNCEEKIKDHEKRIDKLEDTYATLSNISFRMAKVEQSIESIDKTLLNQINDKGKKYEKFVDYIFYAILGILLGYIAIKLGLK